MIRLSMTAANERGSNEPPVRERSGIVVTTPSAACGDAEIESILAALERRLHAPDPYVLVFDLSSAPMPTATQRQALATHMRRNAIRIRQRVLGVAVVAPSSIVRGVVTAVFWLEPSAAEHRVVATLDEALAWAASILGRAG